MKLTVRQHVINGATNSACKSFGFSYTVLSNTNVVEVGGTSGSYSLLSRFADTPSYILTWVSRGAKELTADKFLQGQTSSKARWTNRNVAIAILKDKATLAGQPATSKPGSADGDSQVNWITTGKNDRSNAHAATFDATTALLTWEEIAEAGMTCPFDAMDCQGNFSGTFFQLVDNLGKKIGDPFSSTNVTVSGDMVRTGDGRICWPYMDMAWKLNGNPKNTGSWQGVGGPGKPANRKMSFACVKKP
jgi:hypothetical protein